MIHFSDRLAIGEMIRSKSLDTPMSAIDFLIKEDIISETKLIDYVQKFRKETLPYDHVVLLVNLYENICPSPLSRFSGDYNLIRFLETNGLLNIEAIKNYYDNYNKEFTKN